MKTYIGTSGWMYKSWNEKFFPEDLDKKDWLNYYSKIFTTVEINTTFYHLPKLSTMDKWKAETGKNFIFSLKLYRLFTHFRKLTLNNEALDTLKYFSKASKKLGPKMGPILIQLPPQLKADERLLIKFLDNFIKLSGKKTKMAVEFRHKSWFKKEYYNFLKERDIALVISDSAVWPSAYVKTADFVYCRLHGREKLFASNYKKSTLQDVAKNVKKLKPETLFAYFNNDANAYAPGNAKTFEKILK